MESPQKNNDCYFYYYSKCVKGDNCTFRHEPSALGCETVCSFWKEGKCHNVHCGFRHMELRKNRKAIPCYWEEQPGGCLKPHCPFLHKSIKNGECESLGVSGIELTALNTSIGQTGSPSMDIDRNTSLSNQYNEAKYGSATVDPLVVKFEEESDNESAPTNSPTKLNQKRVVKVKTLEEIRLEKIQAESAAYYFYPGAEISQIPISSDLENSEDLRQRIIHRLHEKSLSSPDSELKKRRLPSIDESETIHKKQKVVLNTKPSDDLGNIRIKTLEEIRLERLNRLKNVSETKKIDEDACHEVSSTSTEEFFETSVKRLKMKPKLRRLKPNQTEDMSELPNITNDESSINNEGTIEITKPVIVVENDISVLESQHSSSKLDDILLLDDDDIDDTHITFKGEDDILKEIDELLNE